MIHVITSNIYFTRRLQIKIMLITILPIIVEDVLVIAGGRPEISYRLSGSDYLKTIDVVMSDGRVCTTPGLPDLPEKLEGFGMTSKKDRYIYVCGGTKREYCFYTCGKMFFFILF